MSIGTYLVGIAIVLIIAAYLGRPFRRFSVDKDKVIEKWVANVRNRIDESLSVPEDENVEELVVTSAVSSEVSGDEAVNFCPQCGRRVEVDHRFCPGCGTQLVKGAAQ